MKSSVKSSVGNCFGQDTSMVHWYSDVQLHSQQTMAARHNNNVEVIKCPWHIIGRPLLNPQGTQENWKTKQKPTPTIAKVLNTKYIDNDSSDPGLSRGSRISSMKTTSNHTCPKTIQGYSINHRLLIIKLLIATFNKNNNVPDT